MPGTPPDIDVLIESADPSLHPLVRESVGRQERLSNLRDELSWWVEVAARDMDYARSYAEHQPVSGAPAEAFLER